MRSGMIGKKRVIKIFEAMIDDLEFAIVVSRCIEIVS